MFTLTAGTILGIVAIVLTVLAALCKLIQAGLDGRDELGEELHNEIKRKKARAARKQWERTVIKSSNGKKYRIRK